MTAKPLVLIGLVSCLWFGSPVLVATQSNWPTAPKAAGSESTPPAKSGKATPPKPKRRTARKSSSVRVETAVLRTISENLARQTLAIEALALRLEAAERRQEAILAAASSDVSAPFRAACAAEWPQVLVELER